MRAVGLGFTALWATLTVLVDAASLRSQRSAPNSAEDSAQKSSSGASLRAPPIKVEDSAWEKVASLEKKIGGLEADKKGLVIAFRHLLKANQTQEQKKMLDALRLAKLETQATAKKLVATELTDAARLQKMQKEQQGTEEQLVQKLQQQTVQLKKLQKLQQGTEEKLVQEMGKLRNLQDKESSEEVTVSALRKSDISASSRRADLEDNVATLTKANAKLQEDKSGLEATVQKLWKANASASSKNMLKILGADEERLKVVDQTRQAEENQWAQEKSDLSQRLSEAEHKHEVDLQTVSNLRGDNLKLHAELKEKASFEARAESLQAQAKASLEAAEGFQEKNKQLEAALSKIKLKEEADLRVTIDNDNALHTKLEKEAEFNQQLLKANKELTTENEKMKAEVSKLGSAKETDENIYLQAVTDLQQKLNKSEALVQQKDKEIKEASARAIEVYAMKAAKIQTAMQDKIAALEKDKHNLEMKLADLSLAEQKRADELAKLSDAGSKMRAMLKKEELKLVYALDKENTEMVTVDKLEAENKADNAALEKALGSVKELEPKVAKLEEEKKVLQASNFKLQASEESAREEVDRMKKTSEVATQNAFQMQKKLDFAVDQENTQTMAVQMLRDENSKLKKFVQNQTELEAVMRQEGADMKEKDGIIKVLQAQKVNAEANITALSALLDEARSVSSHYQDQINKQITTRRDVAEQYETQSLALKALQGQNEKLKSQLQQAADNEADMMTVAKASQAKAAASDFFESQGDQIRAELAESRRKEEALQHKNDQLQETIVSMAAKVREVEVEQKLQVAPKADVKEEEIRDAEVDQLKSALSEAKKQQESSDQAQEPPNLAHETKDLAQLVSQLHNSNEDADKQKAKQFDDNQLSEALMAAGKRLEADNA